MIGTLSSLSGLAAGLILPPALRRPNGLVEQESTSRTRPQEEDRYKRLGPGEPRPLDVETYNRSGRIQEDSRIGDVPESTRLRPERPLEPSTAEGNRPEESASSPTGAAAEKVDEQDSEQATSEETSSAAPGEEKLTEEEQAEVDKLEERDREVRAHEQAHKSAGGGHTGAVQYEYENGPDGKRYAVGGEVSIDLSPVQGDPQATITKMQQVRRAALAPAQPSGRDRAVAAQASKLENEARAELQKSRNEGMNGGEEEKSSPQETPSASKSSAAAAQAFQRLDAHAEPGSLLNLVA